MNKSAIAREFWRKIFNENTIDLKNGDARKKIVNDFLNDPENQRQGWNNTSDKRFFRSALDKVFREQGKSTATIGVKPEPKRNKSKAGLMNMSITTDEKPLHTIIPQKPADAAPEQKKDGKKVLPKEFQSKELLKQQEAIAATYTSASVGTIFETLFNILHAKFNTSKLTPNERVAMGEAWYPIFSEYLTGEGSKWIMPIIITAPIVLVRVSEIQRQKKEEQLKEQYKQDFFDPSQQKKDGKKDDKSKSWSDRL